MRKIIITERQYKLLHEIDKEGEFKDVKMQCIPLWKMEDYFKYSFFQLKDKYLYLYLYLRLI